MTSSSTPLTQDAFDSGGRVAAGLVFRLQSDDGCLRPWLEDLTADFTSSAAPVELLYRVLRREDGFVDVTANGTHLATTTRPARVGTSFLTHLNQAVVARNAAKSTVLHAAAAVRGAVTLVLPALSESGKSTTVAGLCAAGFDYVTDEAAILDPVSLLVEPYPKPITLDAGSHLVLPGCRPGYVTGHSEQWFVPTSRTGARVRSGPTCPALVFPQYRRGQRTQLRPLSAGEALLRAATSTFHFAADAPRHLRVLARLVESHPAHELLVGDLDEAVEALAGLVARLDTTG